MFLTKSGNKSEPKCQKFNCHQLFWIALIAIFNLRISFIKLAELIVANGLLGFPSLSIFSEIKLLYAIIIFCYVICFNIKSKVVPTIFIFLIYFSTFSLYFLNSFVNSKICCSYVSWINVVHMCPTGGVVMNTIGAHVNASKKTAFEVLFYYRVIHLSS